MNTARWLAKKGARASMALASDALQRVQTPPATGCVRVLTYHRLGVCRRSAFTVDVDTFEEQMRWLAENNLAIGPPELERVLDGTQRLSADRVLVTFDDGWHSLHRLALPILRQYDIPAVAFLSVGAIGGDRAPAPQADPRAGERAVHWEEVAELVDGGVVLGSHAWSHRSLTTLPAPAARDELERSRRRLEQFLGRRVRWFAYPFGTRADYDPAVVRMVGESGYECAFTAQHGAVAAHLPRLTLPRVKVEGGEAPWMFRLICRGALDRWRWVDRTLWPLQARHP